MKYKDLIVEKTDSVAKVILNRPNSLNTLSVRLLRELKDVVLDLQNTPGMKAVVLTGGPDIFSAGMDLKDQDVKKMLSGSMAERRQMVVSGPEACKAWEDAKPITIAAIEGYCIGGGVSLVISCDFRVMGKSAYLRIPEIDLGLNYSWGSIPRLIHLIGPAKTKEMVILCEQVAAQKCLNWGLAEEVVADGSAAQAAMTIADKVAMKPPIPVAMTKEAVNRITAAFDQAGIYMDADQFLLTTYTQDHGEGLRAFSEKKAPKFKGR